MKIPAPLLAAALLSACASAEYRDNNAAVDARPECAGTDYDNPAQGRPGWCDREAGTAWSSESEGMKVEFGAGDDDR